MMREYGGYLPLELPLGEEYYTSNQCVKVAGYNNARAAVYIALRNAMPQKIYLPHYNCQMCIQPIQDLGIESAFYQLNDELLPDIGALKNGEMLWWVNYFGNAPESLIDHLAEKYGDKLIIDNAQAFFCKPRSRCYNIYSCRKFFGVSDGAYLIKDDFCDFPLPQDTSFQRADFLLKSIELGTNGAYSESLENEESMDHTYCKMSLLTRRILRSIDYTDIQQRRTANFNILDSKLNAYNNLSLSRDSETYMVYPLLVFNDALRAYLIEHKIYVPHWWRHVPEQCGYAELETKLSRYLLALPIDQRYTAEDMLHLASVVEKGL